MIIVYGTGFIGKHITKALSEQGIFYLCSKTRTYNYDQLREEIELYQPSAIINATGFPTPTNIDFYEDNIDKLVLTNSVGNLMLAALCEELDIHYLTIMSGCIFDGKGMIFTDRSCPNFIGSAYSLNRVQTENILHSFKNTCIVRIRMPISEDFDPKSLITKLSKFEYITNLENSITVLEDCMPLIVNLLECRYVGVVNLVNQGTVTNSQICNLYKNFIDKNKEFKIIRPDQIHAVPRSNCVLVPSRIVSNTPDAYESISRIMKKLKRSTDIFC